MTTTDPRVDRFVLRQDQWRHETEALRAIALECGLTEDLKWGKPCYSIDGGNVVIIQGFKAYCALLFFKGLLLGNAHGALVKTGENTRIGRQMRFTDVDQIVAMKTIVTATILEAIAIERSGLKVEATPATELDLPDELVRKLRANPTLKAAFEALTPGRQRGYVLHFAQPKQSATREARIEKNTQRILDGLGLNDR